MQEIRYNSSLTGLRAFDRLYKLLTGIFLRLTFLTFFCQYAVSNSSGQEVETGGCRPYWEIKEERNEEM